MKFNNAEKIIDYSTFIKGINNIKFDFVIEREKLKGFSYKNAFNSCKKKYEEYLGNYKPQVINSINKLIKLFSGFLKTQKFMLVLNGSFARNSYREYSDIDISFVLDKKKTKAFVVFEELFYYAVSYIFGISRNRVNSIFSLFVDVDVNADYDNNVEIMWDDCNKSIEYVIPKSSGYIFHKNLVSERSYSTLMKLIQAQISSDVIAPKAYTFEVLFNNTEFDLKKDIMGIEFKNRTNFIMPQYDNTMSNLKHANITTRDLKLVVKDLFANELNEFCSYIRHYAVRKYNYLKLLSVKDILCSSSFAQILGKNQKLIRDNYYKYMFYLTRMEMCLDKLGVQLSFLDNTPVDSKKLVELYQNIFNTKENILNVLFDIIAENRQLYKEVYAML